MEALGGALRCRQLEGRIWDYRLRPLGGDLFERKFEFPPMRDYSAVPFRGRFVASDGSVVAFESTPTPSRRWDA